MRLPLAALWLAALAGPLHAAPSPQKIQFQGKLLDTANNPRNGSFDITFRLFNAPSGGSALWTEAQTGVAVNNGVFEASLGAVTALTTALFGGASHYLEVEVSPDPAMTPRLPLLMAPSAFRALLADDLAPGNTSYVQVGQSVQAGAAFHVASGTVSGPFSATGTSTFTRTGSQAYSLVASSGVLLQAGTLRLEGTGGLVAVYAVQAATVSASAGLFLPQGPAVSNEGALRWEPTQNLVFIGTGTSNKTLADTDSAQTLTNKTLNSTGGNVVDATHLRTRLLASDAPSDGMTIEWAAGASQWAPVYGATVTVVYTIVPANNITFGAANRVFITPVIIPGVLRLNQIRFRVTTAVGGVTGDVGLYDPSGSLVASGGTSSADFTTAGAKVVSVQGAPKILQPGQYYAAITATGTPAVRGNTLGGAASIGVIKFAGYAAETGGTTLPSLISLSGIVDDNELFFIGFNE